MVYGIPLMHCNDFFDKKVCDGLLCYIMPNMENLDSQSYACLFYQQVHYWKIDLKIDNENKCFGQIRKKLLQTAILY